MLKGLLAKEAEMLIKFHGGKRLDPFCLPRGLQVLKAALFYRFYQAALCRLEALAEGAGGKAFSPAKQVKSGVRFPAKQRKTVTHESF